MLEGRRVGLGAFACEFGERERTPDSIEGLSDICAAKGLGLILPAMGCKTFWQMLRPVEVHITQCVSRTIAASGVPADEITRIVFYTIDKNLRHIDPDLARIVLSGTGLVNCIPAFISMQQCASSLAAIDYGYHLLGDPRVQHVIIVAFDFVVEDAERVQPFALFGDAVTSFMMRSGDASELELLSYGVSVDLAGLTGRDDFESRKRLAVSTLEGTLQKGGAALGDVEKCFSTNFYRPIALFNAGTCGVTAAQLCIDTMSSRGHCGNCDWVINLVQYRDRKGLALGKRYLVQSFAPGFFGCALLESPS